MSVHALIQRSGGVIGTIGPIGGKGVWSLRERGLLAQDFYDDVSLLLHCNGANGSTTFVDSSKHGHVVTANGDAQISTAQSKFGGASGAFDGTGDYLSLPNVTPLALSSGNFTVELWYYTASDTNQTILAINSNASGYAALRFDYNAGGLVYMLAASAATTWAFVQPSSVTVSLNTWTYLAVVRNSSTYTMFVNGVPVANATSSATMISGTNNLIGCHLVPNVTFPLNGYIDDLRITKGVARYTGSFTPPQRQFRP